MNDLDPLTEFLDGDDPDRVDLSGIDKVEIARHSVVAGIARHLLHEPEESSRDLVRQGMQVVLAEDDRRLRRRFRTRLLSGLAAAAAVVVTAVVMFRDPPSFDAVAQRIQAFALDDIDREYEITIQSQDVIGAILTEGMSIRLFVRSTDHFASQMELNMLGQQRLEIWMGSDGEEFWLVPPRMSFLPAEQQPPVIVSSESLQSRDQTGDLGLFGRFADGFLRTERAGLVFATLVDLRKYYRVIATGKNAPALEAAVAAGDGWIDLTAIRDPQADANLPDKIRMVVEEGTGVVRVMLLNFVELPSHMGIGPPFRTIRYDLVRETVASGDVYRHEAHHDPDREVRYR